MKRLAHICCDPGVRSGASKGAAVHLDAMRRAFRELGLHVDALDMRSDEAARERLAAAHAVAPYDVLYERFALHAYAVSDFAHAAGVPHVIEVNAPLDEEEARHRPDAVKALDRAALQRVLGRAHTVLAVSSDVAEWARSRGARPESVVIEPNGVDTALFHPGLRPAGRALLGLADDAFVVGFHGRLRPWHRVDRIAAAVAALRAEGLDAHLVTLGHGDFAALLAPLLPADAWRGLEWLPHSEVGPIVAAFDALPLGYEPSQPCYFSPLKLREAMAAGVVPVVPDLGDLAHEVAHGGAGIVVAPGDDAALLRALRSLATERSLRLTLSVSAAERGALHTWLSIATRILTRASAGPLAQAGGQP